MELWDVTTPDTVLNLTDSENDTVVVEERWREILDTTNTIILTSNTINLMLGMGAAISVMEVRNESLLKNTYTHVIFTSATSHKYISGINAYQSQLNFGNMYLLQIRTCVHRIVLTISSGTVWTCDRGREYLR